MTFSRSPGRHQPRDLACEIPLDYTRSTDDGYGLATGAGSATFTRATAATYLRGGVWRLAASGVARVGDGGIWLGPTRTNKCTINYGHSGSTGWVKAGDAAATLDDDADAAAVSAAGLGDFDPVLLLDNSAGAAAAYAYPDLAGASTGNVNKHSLQVIARCVGGTGDLGWWDVGAGTFTSVGSLTGTTAYVRDVWSDLTPPDTDVRLCLHAPAGVQIYFLLADLQENAIPTSPIPNAATAATATRNADSLTLPLTPRDAAGAISFALTPRGWDGTDLTTTSILLTRGGYWSMYVNAVSAGQVIIGDGTTIIAKTVAQQDGVAQSHRMEWGPRLALIVDDYVGSAAYDGSLRGSGQWTLGSSTVEVSISDVRCYRRL